MKRKPKPQPYSKRRRGKKGRTASPIAKEGEGKKPHPRPLSKERGVECLGNGGQKGHNLGASVEKV